MPSSENYKRNYKQETRTAELRGEVGGSDSDNAKRKRARRAYISKHGMPKGDIDHKKPLSQGGSNKMANLRDTPAKKNRSFKRNKDGSIKSKKA